MRLSGTKTGSANQYNGLGDQLYDLGGARPTLDLNFANNGSLVDSVTGKTLVQHTRQSNATYVDGDGVIRNAVTNLLLRSEEFDNPSWVKGASTTVTANYAVAPNGTTTADRVEMPNSVGTFVNGSATVVSGLTYTFSVYARATATTSAFVIQLGTNTASYVLTAQWQRYSLSFTATGSSLAAAFDNGNNAVDFLVWGAQLEQSSTVGEYIPTTSTINSAPRFDHDPTTGESLGLLVEESRQNLLLQSEDFSTTWTHTESSENINVAVAPNGTTTADALVDTVNNSAHNVTQSVAGCAGSTSYTFSCYMKKGSKDFGALIFSPNASWGTGSGASVFFDLTNGTISASTSATGTIQALPNGWYRCTATATTAASPGTVFGRIGSSLTGSAQTYEGNGDEAIYLWGAQLEAGSFPTSYISTTGTPATRAADVASISGSNFSSWYRQDEGTVFAEASPKSGAAFLGFNDGTTSNRIRLAHTGTTAASAVNVTGGALQFSDTSGAASFPVNTQGKAALAMKASDFALVGNTSSVVTSTGLMPSANQATIGASIGQATAALNGPIARLTYWPARLPNDTLQTITT
jgi:hypothetical protein